MILTRCGPMSRPVTPATRTRFVQGRTSNQQNAGLFRRSIEGGNRTSFVDLPRFFRTMVTLRRLPRLAAFVPEGRLSNGPGCGGHAFKRNRQEECVQMPVKIARSAPRPSFGLPELLVAIHTSRQSCYKAGKSANIHASSAVIRGIPAKDKITLRNRARVLEAE